MFSKEITDEHPLSAMKKVRVVYKPIPYWILKEARIRCRVLVKFRAYFGCLGGMIDSSQIFVG
jgi:hypothetical protein